MWLLRCPQALLAITQDAKAEKPELGGGSNSKRSPPFVLWPAFLETM